MLDSWGKGPIKGRQGLEAASFDSLAMVVLLLREVHIELFHLDDLVF